MKKRKCHVCKNDLRDAKTFFACDACDVNLHRDCIEPANIEV
jgi:hypothetical protein